MSGWTKPGPRQGCERAAERVYDLVATQGESRYGPIADAIAEETQAPAMVEALDNVTAALESALAHFASKMPKADAMQRERMCAEARAILARLEPRP